MIPPIKFSMVHEHEALVERAAIDRAWAVTFSEMLATSMVSPLSNGEWHLGWLSRYETRNLPPALVKKIVGQRSLGYVEWDFGDDVYPFTLREMSSADSGRVKAWRKHTRDGTLPPILLCWVSGLAAHVVLDGHDRLLAAALNDAPAPALFLNRVTEEHADPAVKAAVLRQVEQALAAAECARSRPIIDRLARADRFMSVDVANALLLDAFSPKASARPTQADALEGGAARWLSEVRRELASQEASSQRLLSGLEHLMSHDAPD